MARRNWSPGPNLAADQLLRDRPSKYAPAMHLYITIDSIVKGLETGLINTFPADSPRCAGNNIVDSFHGCF